MTNEWISLTERSGYLRIYGRESLSSFHHQSMIARRVQHFHTITSCCVEFEPKTFQQIAGIVCYYNTNHFHYLNISGNDNGSKKLLNIISCDKFVTTESLEEPLDITGHSRIYLRADFNKAQLQFYFAFENEGIAPSKNDWQKIGNVLDGSILSDDYVQDAQNRYRPAFTGAFVGMCVQDLTGGKIHADFDWWEYLEV